MLHFGGVGGGVGCGSGGGGVCGGLGHGSVGVVGGGVCQFVRYCCLLFTIWLWPGGVVDRGVGKGIGFGGSSGRGGVVGVWYGKDGGVCICI